MSVENFTNLIPQYDRVPNFLTINPTNGTIYVTNRTTIGGRCYLNSCANDGSNSPFSVVLLNDKYVTTNILATFCTVSGAESGLYVIPLTSRNMYQVKVDIPYSATQIIGPNADGTFQSAQCFVFEPNTRNVLIGGNNTNVIYLYELVLPANTYVESQITLTLSSVDYQPLILVFGKDNTELYALCQTSDSKKHILLIRNPLTPDTRTISIYAADVGASAYSIAYDNNLFLSLNNNGNQVIVKVSNQGIGSAIWDPTVSGRPQLISDANNNMVFYNGDLYFLTTGRYIARASYSLFPVCLTEGTQVLTPKGYVPVEQLKKYDYITTADGRNVTIKHVHHSQHFNAGEMEAPFLVPANALSEGVPLHDVKLSPDHLVLVGDDCWLSPRHMAKRSDKVVQYSLGETIQYYAIMTANYFEDNLVIEDGVVVESYGYRRTVYDEAVKAFRRVAEENVTTE